MEVEFLKSLAAEGPKFILLGYVIYVLVQLLKTVIERRLAIEEKTLAALNEALAGREELRLAQKETALLLKMIADKLNLEHEGYD